MEHAKNPGDKDDKKSSQSEEQPKTVPKLIVKIPIAFLSGEQKKLLSQKPLSKDEPSTSSGEEKHVFKVPQLPPLKKTTKSPSKVSSDAAATVVQAVQGASLEDSASVELKKKESPSKVSSDKAATVVQAVQDASLEDSTIVPKTIEDASLDKEAKDKTQDLNLN